MTDVAFSNKRILILAPHTDDGELGCGATISKLIETSNDVYYVAFSACRQSVLKDFPEDILDKLIEIKKELNPDIVFIPSVNDLHQDHSTIANEAIRAFKNCTILSYEVPWNNVSFNTTCFVRLEEKHLNKKIQAIHEYKSQAHRGYINEDFIKSLATVRGVQVGVKYAETFDVVRLIL